MRPTITVAGCACALALFFSTPATASLHAVAAPRYAAASPGAVVLVRQQDKVWLRRAYGMANVELGVPMRPGHVFRVGSISKTFTAVAVMQLAERGALELGAPVRRYLPALPASWDAVTIEHLLQHRSGIANLEHMPGFAAFQLQTRTLDEVIEWFSKAPLDFAPGTGSRYSSSGYIVLGKLIETVSQQRYEDYLQQHIFKPLGMRHTAYGHEGAVVKGMVSGYQHRARKAGFISMSVPHGAGALISNADDLARFTLALHGGRLVSAASYARMVTPHAGSAGERIRFGYGLVLRNAGGQELIGHSGGIQGFSADVEYDTAARSVAVVLQNTEDDADSASRLATALLAQAFGKPFAQPRAVVLRPAQMQALAGVYPAVATSRVIRYHNGVLTEQFNGAAPVALAMASATDAFVPGSDRRLHFTLKGARAVSVQAYASGQPDGELAQRADDTAPSHAVSAADFSKLAGDYQLTENMELRISQQDGRFFMQASGQPPLEMFAQSPTRFAAREVLISIEFSRNSEGKVSHLTLYQGDVAMPAPRKQ